MVSGKALVAILAVAGVGVAAAWAYQQQVSKSSGGAPPGGTITPPGTTTTPPPPAYNLLVSINKPIVNYGDYETVSFSGFPPNSKFRIFLIKADNSALEISPGPTSDSAGNGSYRFLVGKNLPQGDIRVRIASDIRDPLYAETIFYINPIGITYIGPGDVSPVGPSSVVIGPGTINVGAPYVSPYGR